MVLLSMQIEENKPLAPFTTIGVGGPARWFVQATDEAEILEAVSWASQRCVPLFVLGGGSNLLVSDAGFPGLILHPVLKGIRAADDGRTRIYIVAAGECWDQFVQRAVDDDCAGVECLAGIPGTVGGTPVQNVGAYGQEVSSTIERVRAFDLQTHIVVEFSAEECGFAYRRSRFNSTDRGRYLVTRVDLRLIPGGAPTLRYPDLQRALAANGAGNRAPTLAEVAVAVRAVRSSKGMLLAEGEPDCRSAGSFFKNPVVSEEQLDRIRRASSQSPPQFPAESGIGEVPLTKVPAAWLIEQAGFHKGYRLGGAGISSRHTLALVNLGGATAQEILTLAARITEAVESRFGIRLEREPVLVGFE
jgi:UDP-N-acetylmuramate dehydrogenase